MTSHLKSLLSAFAVALACFTATLVNAAPLFSVVITPPGENVIGAPGQTVGFGYAITNLSTDYLVPTAFNSDAFANGAPLSLFDFPVVAPLNTVRQEFVANTSGLFQFTIDSDALNSFQSGTFVFSANIYTQDPLAGGVFIMRADDVFVGYSITAASAAPIPEPSTILLFLTGFGLLAISPFKRRGQPVCQKTKSPDCSATSSQETPDSEMEKTSISTSIFVIKKWSPAVFIHRVNTVQLSWTCVYSA